jgi:hypothetical protein
MPGELVAERLNEALNAHDIDAFVACLDAAYDSRQPVHPDRAFKGSDQARRNWTSVFEGVPDFESELVSATSAGGIEWSEWRWHGTQPDGTPLDMAGVIVSGVQDGRMIWARLYVEPVQHDGAGIDAAVRDMRGER